MTELKLVELQVVEHAQYQEVAQLSVAGLQRHSQGALPVVEFEDLVVRLAA